MKAAYIVDAVRTPIARHGGGLAAVRTDDLAAHVVSALAARQPEVVSRLNQVIFGATNQAGEDNRNVARMAVLLAGLPDSVPAVTVNRLCGSGLEALTDAVMRVWVGDADVAIAGGVESMTRSPYVFGKASESWSREAPRVYDTSLGWRFENPKMAERFELQSMGMTAENVAARWGITREEQDQFALHSHQKAAVSVAADAFSAERVAVSVPQKKGDAVLFDRDESVRTDASLESLARLRPVFLKGGSVTAGNSSPINDGAAALLVVSEEVVRELNLTPLVRVVSFATAGVEPNYMGEGPIPAGKLALKRAGWATSELNAIELNEAFAAQAIACIRGLELDASRVNQRGGAIAMGHPIGCSGARIAGTLAWLMHQTGQQKGMAALCIGVGQGIALTMERA